MTCYAIPNMVTPCQHCRDANLWKFSQTTLGDKLKFVTNNGGIRILDSNMCGLGTQEDGNPFQVKSSLPMRCSRQREAKWKK